MNNTKHNCETLLAQMTTRQKAAMLSGHEFWHTTSLAELGIESITMADGPMGLRKPVPSQSDPLGLNHSVQSVSFPSSALIASSFDRDLLYQLGERLGNTAALQDVALLLGPGINLKRSPLAGRNFEYFAEDPLVAGELAVAYVNGVHTQGVGVAVKHFAVNNRENQRFTVSSEIDERTLRELYLAHFENVVKNAQPDALMTAYNPVNGVLASENKQLLTDILRDEWGFDGIVMSDWGAVSDSVAAIKNGLNLEMPGNGAITTDIVLAGLQQGQLTMAQLDTAVLAMLKLLTKLEQQKPLRDQAQLAMDADHDFSRQAAAESTILLKNEDAILPLDASTKTVFIGAYVEEPRWQGGGSSKVNPYQVVTPLMALQASDLPFQYLPGYTLDQQSAVDQTLLAEAVAAAKEHAQVVLIVGSSATQESEGFDKADMQLPANQTALIKAILAVNENAVVIVQAASAIEMPWLPQNKSLLWTYLMGETVGEALLDVIYGEIAPTGKLTETLPLRLLDTPAAQTFAKDRRVEIYHEGIFMGYRFYDTRQMPVAFPFGHGLTYTTFNYANLQVHVDAQAKQVEIKVDVTNTGLVASKEIVQVYVANHAAQVEMPSHELRQFAKVHLTPGETKTVTLILDERAFAWYDVQQNAWTTDAGQYTIEVAASSRDIRLTEQITLPWGNASIGAVTKDTLLADLLSEPKLATVLLKYGLQQKADLITDVNMMRMFANVPLRAGAMVGLNVAELATFITDANQALQQGEG
ncbi:MAG: glycoside hydrolase family 3 C-terminal domain-containing protein [Lactobacillaceae bacterium]|jgi:beta-glucosidase|nr:glycoside hydrolase family 3 C-terminal domain-containing protein [Lactobacillaceae bacterium]